MEKVRQSILQNLCYTDLVYSRINKKLGTNLSRSDIEVLIHDALTGTSINDIVRIGKNYYATCDKHNMRITINSRTFRVITIDKIAQQGRSHAAN